MKKIILFVLMFVLLFVGGCGDGYYDPLDELESRIRKIERDKWETDHQALYDIVSPPERHGY